MKPFLTIFFAFCFNVLSAQTFTGTNSEKKLIEFEGQRFLQYEVYQLDTTNYTSLILEKTIKEVDGNEGFLFILTSYKLDENYGVVITSARTEFNSAWNTSSEMGDKIFANIHLTKNEMIEINNKIKLTLAFDFKKNEHLLIQVNPRITLDVFKKTEEGIIVQLWMYELHRHSFTSEKWMRVYNKFIKFTEKN